MSITKLMSNPKARDHYLAIPATMPPFEVADNYRLACAQGDKAKALAYETHMRELAQMHFHRPDVNEALRTVERCSTRKFGTRAGSDLQSIADGIEKAYTEKLYTLSDNGTRYRFAIETESGSLLNLRCRANPAAVAMLAAKYRKGFPRTNWKSRT